MDKTSSKYKIFGGFGLLLLLTMIAGLLTWAVFFKMRANPFMLDSWINDKTRTAMMFALGIQGMTLFLIMTQCKYIIVDSEGITFVNPLLPFIRRTSKWSEYDHFQTVQEDSRGGTYEAVWLIKDNKLRDRFSSFYYSNYSGIKKGIKARNHGRLKINPVKQIFCLLGMRITK